MRIIFGSDIHGSAAAGQALLDAVKKEKADRLILCGDIYYHGPRNPLPGGHDPMGLAEILNENKKIISCVRGNCDSEVDQTISEFAFEDSLYFEFGSKAACLQDFSDNNKRVNNPCCYSQKIFVTHGHKYDKNNPPPLDFDLMIYGHYHVGFIQKMDGKIFASPGSVSLPKNNSLSAYLLLTDSELTLKDFDGNVLETQLLEAHFVRSQ